MRLMTKNKLVYGHGVNDASYNVYKYKWDGKTNKAIWKCPFYTKWSAVLQRCYSEKVQEKYPSYKGCSVCDDWLIFSNFRKWMKTQDWAGKELDKDISGSKIYSPETCLMVSPGINKFFRDILSNKRSFGYSWSGYSYQARIVCKPLGVSLTKRFKVEDDAKNFYLDKRRYFAKKLILLEFGQDAGLEIISNSNWLNIDNDLSAMG